MLKSVRSRWSCLKSIQLKNVKTYSSKTSASIASEEDKPEIPINPIKKYHPANSQTLNGDVYDVKPFKIRLEEGKNYHWCLCGHSRSQPFCDGTHNNIYMRLKQKPIKFQVTKTKEYWLCNCKQTKNRPFCDGTHLKSELQYVRW